MAAGLVSATGGGGSGACAHAPAPTSKKMAATVAGRSGPRCIVLPRFSIMSDYHKLLRHSLQIAVEELDYCGVSPNLILLLLEPVTFIGEHHVLHRNAILSRSGNDLLGFDFQNTRIVCALKHHQRHLDLLGVEKR